MEAGPWFNPMALKRAKTLWSFGHSECNRVNALPERSQKQGIDLVSPALVVQCVLRYNIKILCLNGC